MISYFMNSHRNDKMMFFIHVSLGEVDIINVEYSRCELTIVENVVGGFSDVGDV